ncbi:VRR-NUC domain-containing protein [Auriculariales sp. MPI-PUGE-AT-0066]|nr:VRR-NUC domain-containing protein [Auriculariales sp. MPI-PUGE-AT-0066]
MARRSTPTDAAIFQIEDSLSADIELAAVAENALCEGQNGNTFRESMYVGILKDILSTVLEEERYLFSEQELSAFARFGALTYEAQYLLLRLSLRKEGQWLSFSGLDKSYHADLGPHLASAMHELCGTVPPPTETSSRKPKAAAKPEPEVIDLTLDSDDDDDEAPIRPAAAVSTNQPGLPDAAEITLPNTSFFAQSDQTATLAELLRCMNKDQLKQVAVQALIAKASTKNREELVESLMTYASSQSTLSTANGPFKQLQLNFYADKKLRTQSDILRKKIMEILGACIKVQTDVMSLLRRLQIVFFRATIFSVDLFLPSILSRAKRRNYPKYTYTRTTHIFPSRERFLDYENALKIEGEIDSLLDGYGFMYQPKSKKAKAHAEAISTTPRQDAAQRAKELACGAWQRWDELVADAENEGLDEHPCLARFHPGHVYTRILSTSCRALALLKDHKAEVRCLKDLLSQTIWRRSKRGMWYERLALLYMQHGKNGKIIDDEDLAKYANNGERYLHLARETVLNGLADSDTHLVHRLTLENRLQRIENKLKLPKEDRHNYLFKLKKPKTVSFTGTRIWDEASSPSKAKNQSTLRPNSAAETPWTGKSVWAGAHGQRLSVEELAIEWYSKKGFKALHSEGRVVTSLFALLFWDILFTDVPGAFETKFQSAPLDIFHDTFYASRRDLIEERLKRISSGGGRALIEEVDGRERERQSVCIGMRWDKFSRHDIVEIGDCLGGPALAVMCRILCEDYAERVSGVPDLLAWDPSKNKAKFIEVKGPGDQLRDNQRMWIHCLRNAGVEVELCKVAEDAQDRSRSQSAKLGDESSGEESEPDLGKSHEDDNLPASTPPRKRPRPSPSTPSAKRNGKIMEVVIDSPRKRPRAS